MIPEAFLQRPHERSDDPIILLTLLLPCFFCSFFSLFSLIFLPFFLLLVPLLFLVFRHLTVCLGVFLFTLMLATFVSPVVVFSLIFVLLYFAYPLAFVYAIFTTTVITTVTTDVLFKRPFAQHAGPLQHQHTPRTPLKSIRMQV
jgi:hypothetical protein